MNIRKATAEAPSNLAFVKYWGKRDPKLNIPLNNSISVNLSNATTTTTVEFDDNLERDEIIVDSNSQPGASFSKRVIGHLDRVRDMAGVYSKARVTTVNNFPMGIGIASSASGFAALTVAATAALKIDLSQQEMSSLARLGSGSACRSIPDGFVEWVGGHDHQSSHAVEIAPPSHWDIAIVSIIVNKAEKKLSSSDGQALAAQNPYMEVRQRLLPKRLEIVRSSILQRAFDDFGKEVELDAVSFHAIAMTSPFMADGAWHSGAYYWAPETIEIIHAVQEWRAGGVGVYFTIDAGATVHLICPGSDLNRVSSLAADLQSAKADRRWQLITNRPAQGARVIAVGEA